MVTKKPRIHVVEGSIPVLISAPHTRPIVKHDPTNGPYVKPKELRINPLVRQLCRETGAWGIFVRGKSTTIANWDSYLLRAYKKRLKNIVQEHGIALVLDIHGSETDRPFSVDYDFKVSRRHPYDARHLETLLTKYLNEAELGGPVSKGFFSRQNGIGRHTITYFIRRNFHIAAIQLEVNKFVRVDAALFQKVKNAIKLIIVDYLRDYKAGGIQIPPRTP
jgi:succinylglutamate desuccinylase